jgi:anionic cell wall polymer biosynthesis LytR-Cps2A-Psr (LCP) family protein
VGGLLGLTIDGSMWVNPVGLARLIDDVGGIDINVPTTVYDEPCGPARTWQNKFHYCAYAHDGCSVPTGVDGGRIYSNAAMRLGARVRFMDAFRG